MSDNMSYSNHEIDSEEVELMKALSDFQIQYEKAVKPIVERLALIRSIRPIPVKAVHRDGDGKIVSVELFTNNSTLSASPSAPDAQTRPPTD